MPRRTPAALPRLIALPQDSTLRGIVRTLNQYGKFLRASVTQPSLPPPTGPFSASVSAVGSTNVVVFQADTSGPIIKAYRVWRAVAGTRSAPTTPGADQATRIAVVAAIDEETGGQYRYLDRDFTVTQLDPANPTRFSYWVQSVDDRGLTSSMVIASGSPIEATTNGPGDQSPEQTIGQLNKLINTTSVDNNGVPGAMNLPRPVAITSSTNASPIVLTVPSGHGVVANDLVAVDNHDTNTNANGWWRVSAVAATTITLQGSTGNGVGGATGKVYRVQKEAWGWFPPTNPEYIPVPASGQAAAYTRPRPTVLTSNQDKFCTYIPWYSEQASLAQANYGNSGFFGVLNGGAGVTNSFAQEVGMRKFGQTMSLCFSVYAYFAGVALPTSSKLKLEVLGVDVNGATETSLFSTTWDQTQVTNSAGGGARRFVFNFRLGNISSYDRLKFRISNVCVSGTGQDLVLYGPMVNMGDAVPPFSSITEPTDWGSPVNLATGAWSRTVAQYINRDASAPYA